MLNIDVFCFKNRRIMLALFLYNPAYLAVKHSLCFFSASLADRKYSFCIAFFKELSFSLMRLFNLSKVIFSKSIEAEKDCASFFSKTTNSLFINRWGTPNKHNISFSFWLGSIN